MIVNMFLCTCLLEASNRNFPILSRFKRFLECFAVETLRIFPWTKISMENTFFKSFWFDWNDSSARKGKIFLDSQVGLLHWANNVEERVGFVAGDLAISIDGPSKADITKKESKDGSTSCSFVPMSPGEYNVNIKVKGKHIHGSPFSAKISGRSCLLRKCTRLLDQSLHV